MSDSDTIPHQWSFLHLFGFLFLLISLPPVAIIVGSCTLWFYVDPITPWVCSGLSKVIGGACTFMTRNKNDGYLFPTLILQAIVVPLALGYCFWHYVTHGYVAPLVAYAYHLVRIGPYFTNFAYAETLMHKEGHTKIGMWRKPYSYLFAHVWNWWIAMFYGVLPSTFANGHSLNHHRYNNDEEDNVTTWDRPRDSFLNYVRYLPRWVLYHINVSSVIQFAKEGNHDIVIKMLIGSFYYYGIFYYFLMHYPMFAIVYIGYPLIEACLLLSAINWSWHAFLDPDTTNEFASSVTILEGDYKTNILNEDYHVVHHQYPGAHWTQHPVLYEKRKEEYIANRATVFLKTHAMEIFFLAILKKYEVFADKFVDLSGNMSRKEIVELIKKRLRTVSWGPYANKVK